MQTVSLSLPHCYSKPSGIGDSARLQGVAAYLTIAGLDGDPARERDSARIELRLFEIVAAIGSGGTDETGGAAEGDDVAAGGGGLTFGCERTLTLTVAGTGTGSTGGNS